MMIIGLVLGLVIMFFALRPRLKTIQNNNKIIEEQKISLENSINFYTNEINRKKVQLQSLETKQAEFKKHIEDLREQADKDNEIIYQKSRELMEEKLSAAADKEAEKFQQAQEEAKETYLQMLEEISKNSLKEIEDKRKEVADLEEKLSVMRAKADAAIAAAKREEEKLLEIDKYKILVTDLDLLEINRLREIAPYFRNARAIYKIIWESYYRNLTTEMISRVIGSGTHTGIYKLTNTKNQKIYIGQAVDLASRWKDHIKCGLGIDAPNNMLYKAMQKDGVENFTFEVLEECERSQLNDREKYYIEFYRAQEHGYNMSRGGARN